MSGPGPLRLPRTLALIEAGRAEGLHLGAQLYVSLASEVVADLALGEDRPGVPLGADFLMPWMSSGKPVTAVAVAQLWERGLLDLDDPIARFVPEFGQGGKQAITLRHALTHTGGFRMLDVGWPRLAWEETLARICAARLEPRWEPGGKAGYHDAPSWFVLGEVVQRLSGRPYPAYVRAEILEPLGMADSWIGMPVERFGAYAASGRLAAAWDTSKPAPERLEREEETFFTRPSPAGGALGPLRELGRFYEMVLGRGSLERARVLSPQALEALTARHRVGMFDHTFRQVMDWSLGFVPDSKQYGEGVPYAYGRHCSARAVGHSGVRSSVAFADPEQGLAVALAWNGLPGDEAHQLRARRTCEAIYEDLGLVPAEEA